MPGSMMSSTITSYGAAPAIQSASSPAAGDIGGVPLLAQTAREQRRQFRLVFDDQDAHGTNCARGFVSRR